MASCKKKGGFTYVHHVYHLVSSKIEYQTIYNLQKLSEFIGRLLTSFRFDSFPSYKMSSEH